MKELQEIIRPKTSEVIKEIAKFLRMSPLSVMRWVYNKKTTIPPQKAILLKQWISRTKLLTPEQKRQLKALLNTIVENEKNGEQNEN